MWKFFIPTRLTIAVSFLPQMLPPLTHLATLRYVPHPTRFDVCQMECVPQQVDSNLLLIRSSTILWNNISSPLLCMIYMFVWSFLQDFAVMPVLFSNKFYNEIPDKLTLLDVERNEFEFVVIKDIQKNFLGGWKNLAVFYDLHLGGYIRMVYLSRGYFSFRFSTPLVMRFLPLMYMSLGTYTPMAQ